MKFYYKNEKVLYIGKKWAWIIVILGRFQDLLIKPRSLLFLTTRKLFYIFWIVFCISASYTIACNLGFYDEPRVLIANTVSNIGLLCLGAIIIDFLLVGREEEYRARELQTETSNVLIAIKQNGAKKYLKSGVYLIPDIDGENPISNPKLWTRENKNTKVQKQLLFSHNGEYSTIGEMQKIAEDPAFKDLSRKSRIIELNKKVQQANRICSLEDLHKAVLNLGKKGELVISWKNAKNENRQRTLARRVVLVRILQFRLALEEAPETTHLSTNL